jgi:transcriptional regulator with XRE-family HTH domain
MAFPKRLATLRKARGLTQRALAQLVDLSLIQIHRYEAGAAQPTLEGIRKLAKALRVSADSLVFEQDERGPDEEFRLQFEALTSFDRDEKKAAKALLDALILKHQARRWASAS